MSRKIFRSTLAIAAAVLLASLVIVLGCLYDYFSTAQAKQLKDELRLAACAVEESGQAYLERLTARDYRYDREADYRLTWIASDGTVLFDTVDPAEQMGNHGDRAEVREAFAAGESSSVRYSETLTQRTLYYARLLNDGTVLRISAGQMTVLALVLAMLQPILLVGIFAVILSAVLASRMARRAASAVEQERGERSRREFTANVSHELKTPLQSILGSAELLQNGLVKPEDVPQFSGVIHTEAARLVALVEDIIHLGQLDEGIAPAREEVDLLETAKSAASALEDSAAKKQVRISVTGESAQVSGVPGFLYELVYNLCDNAVKYNVEGGRVDVSVGRRGQNAVLTVQDTGIGIPANCQDRVFERFFRVDKSRSKQNGGTGLGLSIVKHIAQYHGADIELQSQPGQGTVISVRFPLQPEK